MLVAYFESCFKVAQVLGASGKEFCDFNLSF